MAASIFADLLLSISPSLQEKAKNYLISPSAIGNVIAMANDASTKPLVNDETKQRLWDVQNTQYFNSTNYVLYQPGVVGTKYQPPAGTEFLAGDISQANAMIKQKTSGRIDGIFPVLPLGREGGVAGVAVANITLFKCPWETPFRSSNPKMFQGIGSSCYTERMELKAQFAHYRNNGCEHVIIPLESDETMCVLVYPDNPQSLHASMLLAHSSIMSLKGIMDFQVKEIKLDLPLMKLEGGMELSSSLKEKYVPAVMDKISANARVDAIVSRSLLIFDEIGAEGTAVAATVTRSIDLTPMITVTRPFGVLMYVGNAKTMTPIFAGMVNTPDALIKNRGERVPPLIIPSPTSTPTSPAPTPFLFKDWKGYETATVFSDSAATKYIKSKHPPLEKCFQRLPESLKTRTPTIERCTFEINNVISTFTCLNYTKTHTVGIQTGGNPFSFFVDGKYVEIFGDSSCIILMLPVTDGFNESCTEVQTLSADDRVGSQVYHLNIRVGGEKASYSWITRY